MEGKPEADAGRNQLNLRGLFVAGWSGLLLAKLLLAWRLPLFVDEAFYAWESRHPDWAYSEIPALTPWLARVGLELGGMHALALRLPFLLLGSALPWLVARIARRWFGDEAGWRAGLLAMLMPLSALLGVMALPDVPLVLASLLCLDAIAALRERPGPAAFAELACALALGALSHYRFAMVLFAGLCGLLLDPRARRLLRSPGLWLALALGALAWAPLLLWNFAHGSAGLRFQLVERNPWSFHADGIAWLAIQFLIVTPSLVPAVAGGGSPRLARTPAGSGGLGPARGHRDLLRRWLVRARLFRRQRARQLPLAARRLAGAGHRRAAAARVMERARALAGLVGRRAGHRAGARFPRCACLPSARDALAASRLYPNDFTGAREGVGVVARARHRRRRDRRQRLRAGRAAGLRARSRRHRSCSTARSTASTAAPRNCSCGARNSTRRRRARPGSCWTTPPRP
jgi:hypothetical protein